MSTFGDIYRSKLHDYLDDIVQTSTVDAFYNHFEAIKELVSSSHPWLPEVYFADRFIYGLRSDIQPYVINYQPCTVFDAYHLALIYEYCLKKGTQQENNVNDFATVSSKFEAMRIESASYSSKCNKDLVENLYVSVDDSCIHMALDVQVVVASSLLKEVHDTSEAIDEIMSTINVLDPEKSEDEQHETTGLEQQSFPDFHVCKEKGLFEDYTGQATSLSDVLLKSRGGFSAFTIPPSLEASNSLKILCKSDDLISTGVVEFMENDETARDTGQNAVVVTNVDLSSHRLVLNTSLPSLITVNQQFRHLFAFKGGTYCTFSSIDSPYNMVNLLPDYINFYLDNVVSSVFKGPSVEEHFTFTTVGAELRRSNASQYPLTDDIGGHDKKNMPNAKYDTYSSPSIHMQQRMIKNGSSNGSLGQHNSGHYVVHKEAIHSISNSSARVAFSPIYSGKCMGDFHCGATKYRKLKESKVLPAGNRGFDPGIIYISNWPIQELFLPAFSFSDKVVLSVITAVVTPPPKPHIHATDADSLSNISSAMPMSARNANTGFEIQFEHSSYWLQIFWSLDPNSGHKELYEFQVPLPCNQSSAALCKSHFLLYQCHMQRVFAHKEFGHVKQNRQTETVIKQCILHYLWSMSYSQCFDPGWSRHCSKSALDSVLKVLLCQICHETRNQKCWQSTVHPIADKLSSAFVELSTWAKFSLSIPVGMKVLVLSYDGKTQDLVSKLRISADSVPKFSLVYLNLIIDVTVTRTLGAATVECRKCISSLKSVLLGSIVLTRLHAAPLSLLLIAWTPNIQCFIQSRFSLPWCSRVMFVSGNLHQGQHSVWYIICLALGELVLGKLFANDEHFISRLWHIAWTAQMVCCKCSHLDGIPQNNLSVQHPSVYWDFQHFGLVFFLWNILATRTLTVRFHCDLLLIYFWLPVCSW